jgi:hypothetical protein
MSDAVLKHASRATMAGSRVSGGGDVGAVALGDGDRGLGGGLPTTEEAADAGRIGRVCWLKLDMVMNVCFFRVGMWQRGGC